MQQLHTNSRRCSEGWHLLNTGNIALDLDEATPYYTDALLLAFLKGRGKLIAPNEIL